MSAMVRRLCTALARAATVIALAGSGGAAAETPPDDGAPQEVKDAWIDGRLETTYALNPYLNPFDIHTDVDNGVVSVSGTLESDIYRELAIDIARAVAGVREVKSSLAVEEGSMHSNRVIDPEAERSFFQWVQDATTTARVRSSLMANGNTKNLPITVDTRYDVVTLSGYVESRKNKMLAEMIARNTEGISSVKNKLEIDE